MRGATEKTRRYVDKLKATGGTEMLPALHAALDVPAKEGFLRQVVFMTDGSVGNEDALFTLIQKKLGRSRLFTIGIGSAPNSHFMTKAAQLGRGSFTYIGDVAEVAEKMGALFGKLEHPVLSDIVVECLEKGTTHTTVRRFSTSGEGDCRSAVRSSAERRVRSFRLAAESCRTNKA